MWWLIGCAPDFGDRGPGFESDISDHDPVAQEKHIPGLLAVAQEKHIPGLLAVAQENELQVRTAIIMLVRPSTSPLTGPPLTLCSRTPQRVKPRESIYN